MKIAVITVSYYTLKFNLTPQYLTVTPQHSSLNTVREVKKKQNWMGVSGRVHFSRFFFTFNVKIMSKNWKRMIKQW